MDTDPVTQRSKPKSGRPSEVGGLEDHSLIMLLYYRCYVTQEFLGFFYQVDRSIQRIEAHVKPAFAVQAIRQEAEALIIDCTVRLAAAAVIAGGQSGGDHRH